LRLYDGIILPEIFNDIGAKIDSAMRMTVSAVASWAAGGWSDLPALDIGCGASNLSRAPLLNTGAHVTGADLSTKLLDVRPPAVSFASSGRFETVPLNGRISAIPD
jgi:predicted RNA methylase